jgi:hypothetical protein
MTENLQSGAPDNTTNDVINIDAQLAAIAGAPAGAEKPQSTGEAGTITTIGAISAAAVQSAYNRIASLAKAREHWQTTVFTTANEGLYLLLADCYRLYNDMLGKHTNAARLREAFEHHCGEKQLSFKASTHTMDRIVRIVFGNADRRRVSAYAIALRAALASDPKVGPDDFAEFVRQAGGVEEVRMAASKKQDALSPKDKAAVAKSALTKRPAKVVVTDSAFCAELDAAKVDQHHVLIAQQQADGSLILRAIVSSDTVVNAALQAYYSANKEALKTEKVEDATKAAAAKTAAAFEEAREQAAAQAA